ncbi:MAG TPA: PilN domain-containing protein [Opitutaceae bacterium]|nr:PilN domain-containing protein [Opitutaceae bacterium]
MADKPTQPKLAGGRRLPEQPVILVPGHHFFTATAAVPAGTPEKELPGLAALAIETDSPFAEEQLARGHFAAAEGLVVFAALRRKFAAVQETWAKAAFVVPDFATWLPAADARGGVVVLETAECVTALDFAAGSALPRAIVSRPVPAEAAGEEGIAAVRELVLAHLGTEHRTRRFRLAETPCTLRGARYEFHWEAQEAAAARAPENNPLAAAQLWAMDLREPEFLRTKRRDFQWNRYAWGALVGLGAAALLLLVGELGLVGVRFANSRRQSLVERQTPAARTAEANSDIVARLAGYIDRKPQPLELLAYVNDLRPRSIYFTKVSVEGGLQMVVEGSTNVLAEINEFEAALRRAPAFANVEVKNIRAREGGGTFQLTLAFRPGFSLATATGAPNPTSQPAAEAQPARAPSGPNVSAPPPGRRQLVTGDPRAARPPAPAAAAAVPVSAGGSFPPPPPPEDGGSEPPPPPS